MSKKIIYSRIDMMDGKPDGKLFGVDIAGRSSIIMQCNTRRSSNSRVQTQKGVVDCAQLWRKLKSLTDIAYKTPVVVYAIAHERARQTGIPQYLQGVKKPLAKDMAVHTMLTVMMKALLTLKFNPNATYKALFRNLKDPKVFQMIGMIFGQYAKFLGASTPQQPRTLNDLYAFMSWAGTKYSFDPKPFKPSASSSPTVPRSRPTTPNAQPKPLPRPQQSPQQPGGTVHHF